MANRLTVFYSWQADSPFSLNRGFIGQAIHEALKRLHLDAVLENASRDISLEPNQDTQAIANSPSIAETFLRKIDECAVFVADLTLVALPKGVALVRYGAHRSIVRVEPDERDARFIDTDVAMRAR